MINFKKNSIFISMLGFSSLLISCEHVVSSSSNQVNTNLKKEPFTKESHFFYEVSSKKFNNFTFFIGSEIKPLAPNYKIGSGTLFTEDTNSETETLSQLGLTLNEKTGVITGNPIESGIGTTTITIVAKNKNNPAQVAPSFQLNITTVLETCPQDPVIADSTSSWKIIHGNATAPSLFEFRYSHLDKNKKMTCVYEKKQLTNSDLFLVLEKENKVFNPSQYLKKHTNQWVLSSSESYYCQPKLSKVSACPFY